MQNISHFFKIKTIRNRRDFFRWFILAFGSQLVLMILPVSVKAWIGTRMRKQRKKTTCSNQLNAGLYSWGLNSVGQLGLLDTVNRSCPTQVGTLTDWNLITAGYYNSFSIKSAGTLWVIGGSGGYTGLNDTISRSSPVQIGALTGWTSLNSGRNYTPNTMGIQSGKLWMWGSASGYMYDPPYGRLGRYDTSFISSPVQMGALTTWTFVNVGLWHAHAIKGGQLWSWGNNFFYKLGVLTSNASNSSPIQIGSSTDWISVGAGSNGGLGIRGTTSGSLWCWGKNDYGFLGCGASTSTTYSSPVQVGTLTTWTKVGVTSYSVLALRSDNSLWGWGANSYGQLGLGNTTARSSPVLIGTLWKDFSLGVTHALGIKTDNSLWGWGLNSNGQLGLKDTTQRLVPTQIGTLTTWSKISAGNQFSLATKSAN